MNKIQFFIKDKKIRMGFMESQFFMKDKKLGWSLNFLNKELIN
jgi:hypothetical protein